MSCEVVILAAAKQNNSKAIFDEFFTADGQSKVPKAAPLSHAANNPAGGKTSAAASPSAKKYDAPHTHKRTHTAYLFAVVLSNLDSQQPLRLSLHMSACEHLCMLVRSHRNSIAREHGRSACHGSISCPCSSVCVRRRAHRQKWGRAASGDAYFHEEMLLIDCT